MRFIQKGDLNVHLKIHDDSKEFPCNWKGCGKSFKTKNNLTQHKLIHVGDGRLVIRNFLPIVSSLNI